MSRIMVEVLDYLPAIDLEGFKPVDRAGRMYRKEAIYEGKFVKKTPEDQVEFEVKRQHLDNWVRTIEQLLSNGVEIPMPVGHTTDPEKKRASVVGAEVGPASHDPSIDALYVYLRFRDAQAEKDLKASNVSIHTIKEFTDGKGNHYEWPIMHVAFTDYPVVPGLGPFQAIAASMLGSQDEVSLAMNEFLQQIVDALGVPVEDGADDQAATDAIIEFAMGGTGEETGEEIPDDVVAASQGGGGVKERTTKEVFAGFSPTMLKMGRTSRETQIDALVTKGKITPAVAKTLKTRYVNDKAIAVALSQDVGAEDPFDTQLAVLEQMPVHSWANRGELTGRQDRVSLGHDARPEESPLVRRARAARERAENNVARR